MKLPEMTDSSNLTNIFSVYVFISDLLFDMFNI